MTFMVISFEDLSSFENFRNDSYNDFLDVFHDVYICFMMLISMKIFMVISIEIFRTISMMIFMMTFIVISNDFHDDLFDDFDYDFYDDFPDNNLMISRLIFIIFL